MNQGTLSNLGKKFDKLATGKKLDADPRKVVHGMVADLGCLLPEPERALKEPEAREKYEALLKLLGNPADSDRRLLAYVLKRSLK